jgi:uncharacterized protein (DUF934 family)
MPSLISDKDLIEDNWHRADADKKISPGDKVILSLDRLLQQGGQLITKRMALGVELEPAAAVEELLPFLEHLQIVVLRFDNFADGRAFSQARLLRDRYAYRADIRAVGDVLCDQLSFMRRCGFNQFQLGDNEDVEFALGSFGNISLHYQNELKQAVGAPVDA